MIVFPITACEHITARLRAQTRKGGCQAHVCPTAINHANTSTQPTAFIPAQQLYGKCSQCTIKTFVHNLLKLWHLKRRRR